MAGEKRHEAGVVNRKKPRGLVVLHIFDMFVPKTKSQLRVASDYILHALKAAISFNFACLYKLINEVPEDLHRPAHVKSKYLFFLLLYYGNSWNPTMHMRKKRK